MTAARITNVVSSQVQIPTSWEDYISMVMTDSGYVSRGGIYGTDGRTWAASPGFELGADELTALVEGFTDPSRLWRDGIEMAGRRLTCTRCESGVIVARESAAGTGCVLCKCNTCVLVGVHEEGVLPGGCYNLLLKLGDHLRDLGL